MTSARPLVSHLIVTYQQRAFVEQALEAAVSQRYDPLRVVVSDDGSTDGTAELVQAFARRHPRRVTAILNENNLGVTRNCNRALAHCRGEFVSFQGGDDVLLPGKIERQVALLSARPDVVLCGHAVEQFVEDSASGRASTRSVVPPLVKQGDAAVVIREGPPFAAVSVMVRARALPTYGFDERLSLTSDWKLWIDCLAGTGGRFAVVDGVLARYRIHSGSVSRARRARHEEEKYLTLALTELQYPRYAAACRDGRARLLRTTGEAFWNEGDVERARAFFWASLAERPLGSWRAAALAMLSSLPAPLREALRAALRARRRFGSRRQGP